MELNIGISANNSKEVAKLLNHLLSDEFLLYTKTLNYHWNVYGMQFHDLHKFFEHQYEELFDIIDEVAERARSLGERSFGSMTEFLGTSKLQEQAGLVPSAPEMIRNLLIDHEAIIRLLRDYLQRCQDKLGDMGTSNFMTDIMERHEKMAWMLRSCLEQAASQAKGVL